MPAKAGEIVYLPVTLQTSAGAAAVYADKTALTAAGYAFVYTVAGVAVVSPTWTLTVVNSTLGQYEIGLTVQAGQGAAYLNPPTGYVSNVAAWILDVESNDLDSIATVYATVQGTPGIQSRVDGDLGQVVDGDAFTSPTLTALVADLIPTGQATLTGLTLQASCKNLPTDTAIPVTCAAVVAADNTFKVSWVTFPAAMALTGTEQTKDFFFDAQAIKAGSPNIIVTIYRFKITVVWQREVRIT